MKKVFSIITTTTLLYISGFSSYTSPSLTSNNSIDANKIRTVIFNDGQLDRIPGFSTAGFEWPKDSNKFAVYASGLWIGAMINDSVRVSIAEYSSPFRPGYFDFNTQTPGGQDDPAFRVYKVSPVFPNGSQDSDAWSLWPVSQGAPWVDVNGNGVYEPPTDYPVMKGTQNLFCSFTDGYTDTVSNPLRTLPLRAEIHLYVWAKENPTCADAINYEWKIINKNISPWTGMSAALWSDVDIGTSINDKAGTDSSLNLVYGYNGTDNDPIYGTSPPAVGYAVKEATGHNLQKADFASRWRCAFDCPVNSSEIFNVLRGLRAGGSSWINPVTNRETKFPYSGDPAASSGWFDSTQGDRYVIIGSMIGSVASLDTVDFKTVTLIKRGTNNLTGVSEIKNCINSVIGINNLSNSIPEKFSLSQNYPNPFNPITKIKFDISSMVNGELSIVNLKVFDLLGREVMTLVNEKLSAGSYEAEFDGSNFSSGIYYYRFETRYGQSQSFIQTKKMLLIK